MSGFSLSEHSGDQISVDQLVLFGSCTLSWIINSDQRRKIFEVAGHGQGWGHILIHVKREVGSTSFKPREGDSPQVHSSPHGVAKNAGNHVEIYLSAVLLEHKPPNTHQLTLCVPRNSFLQRTTLLHVT